MITVSDNESCNELVKLQTDSLDFKKGAEDINKYLEKEGYTETSVQHTLHPAASAQESLGGRRIVVLCFKKSTRGNVSVRRHQKKC